MLKISVEILPGGNTDHRRSLATMTIANVSGLADISDYEISASEAKNPIAGTKARSCQTSLQGYDRGQSVWAIIAAAAATVIDQGTDWVDW